MPPSKRRIVADVGNSRLKWGRIDDDGRLATHVALPLDDAAAWEQLFAQWDLSAKDGWSISTVNPTAASTLAAFLASHDVGNVRWYRSAADVPLKHRLPHPEKAGADRALAVLGALTLVPAGLAGLVISCGTAVTVERIAADGFWEGGAIAPGLGFSLRAMKLHIAQLPTVDLAELPSRWGNTTESAMAAGVFWGAVGSIRELIAGQNDTPRSWILWTGGDAEQLAPHVEGSQARVVSDLVLLGLGVAEGMHE